MRRLVARYPASGAESEEGGEERVSEGEIVGTFPGGEVAVEGDEFSDGDGDEGEEQEEDSGEHPVAGDAAHLESGPEADGEAADETDEGEVDSGRGGSSEQVKGLVVDVIVTCPEKEGHVPEDGEWRDMAAKVMPERRCRR